MRIFRFIKAVFKFILYGNIVDIETQKERINECFSCEFMKESACSICECEIELKTKWSTESCPKNKW